MIDVFDSLVDVNERFNRLIFDPLYMSNFDLTVKSSVNHIRSINNQRVSRICSQLLPRIHSHVNKITCEPHSIERILFTMNYPQLDSLSFLNFEKETFYQYLTGNSILPFLLIDQIKQLVVEIKNETTTEELSDENKLNIFSLIIFLSKRLTDLTFHEWSSDQRLWISIFNLPTTNCVSSSILTRLKIDVNTFDDCLYLLDGRFECLSTLIINILKISISISNIDNTKKLPKLKHFSLISIHHTIFYDKQIVPLLQRMINLEELTLFLSVLRVDTNYIDSIHLYDEIVIHMSRLNKFTFSIVTQTVNKNTKIVFPLNNNIQSNFIKRGYNQIGSYGDFNSIMDVGRYHIYSLPYQFEMFINLNNFFQGGMFNNVRCLIMNDTNPFEHDLFKHVSQAFPYLEKLYVCNIHAQKTNQHPCTLVVFSHLVALNLGTSHVDYAEEFLVEKKTRLPRLRELTIEYERLAIVTNNFTNDATRLNCTNLQNIHVEGVFVLPENFYQYFPLL